MKTISFVIPVYRNQGTIKLTYENILRLFDTGLSSYNYEFIFIDDGSDDNSLQEILEIKDKDRNHVKIISFSRNFGQVAAEIAGFREVSGDAAIRISADLQEPVDMIKKMITEWENGIEIVICYRMDRSDGFISRYCSSVFYGIIKLLNPKMPQGGFDFLLMDKNPLNQFNKIDERNRFVQADIMWLGFNVNYLPYKRLKRTIGVSQWTFSKKIKYFMDGLTSTFKTSLRLISLFGIAVILFGVIYTSYRWYAYLFHDISFNNWEILSIFLSFFGGLLFIVMGMLGEYIWRIYDETRKRPNYIIRKKYE